MHFGVTLTRVFPLTPLGEGRERRAGLSPQLAPSNAFPSGAAGEGRPGKAAAGRDVSFVARESPQEPNCRWELLNLIWSDTDLPVRGGSCPVIRQRRVPPAQRVLRKHRDGRRATGAREGAAPDGGAGVTTAFSFEGFCSHGGVWRVRFEMKAPRLAAVPRGAASCRGLVGNLLQRSAASHFQL